MKSLKFSAPDDLHRWVKARARKTHRSEASIIREALYNQREQERQAARAA
jgi:predicted transcriptional regulator